jgi:hypothetical protein
MSKIVGYIILFPLIVLLYYAIFNFIFWNTVKKVWFLWFSAEKKLEQSEKITEDKKWTKKKK